MKRLFPASRVRSMLELELYSSRIGADDRVHGFDLIVGIDVVNPTNPASDDSLAEAVEPFMTQLAASYAQAAHNMDRSSSRTK